MPSGKERSLAEKSRVARLRFKPPAPSAVSRQGQTIISAHLSIATNGCKGEFEGKKTYEELHCYRLLRLVSRRLIVCSRSGQFRQHHNHAGLRPTHLSRYLQFNNKLRGL